MTDKKNFVVLVDENDNPVGLMEKLQAHLHPALHRAVSLLVFNTKGEWLLHQRANEKYHSGGLWTNACCTHPYPDEKHEDAARRRLLEEMGIKTEIHFTPAFDFIYKAKVADELTEYEYDRVFTCVTDELPKPNPQEVQDWKYTSHDQLKIDLKENPEKYTEWFKIIFERVNMTNTNIPF